MHGQKQYSLREALCLPAEEVITSKLKHPSFSMPVYYIGVGWKPAFIYTRKVKYPDEARIAMRVMPTYVNSVHPLSVICYDVLENNFIGMSKAALYAGA